MIDAMFQTGTDKALDDQVQRPRPVAPVTNTFSFTQLLKAPGKGIGAGVAESIAFGSEVAGAFGQVLGATGTDSAGGMFSTQSPAEAKQSQAAREKLLTTGIDYSNEAGDNFRERAKAIMPDPETAHASEQVTAGLFRFGTKAVGYTVSGGIIPGAALLGFDEGLTEADRLKQQGVDIDTRTQAGAVAGVVAGGSVLIPMTGATAATRFVKGVAVGEGTMMGQAVAEKAILANAGYDKIANTFDPFDPVSLAVGLVPGMLGAKFGHAAPKKLDALKTDADVRAAAALSPDEAARSAAFERSAANLRELEAAVKAEKDPGARLLLVDELEKQRTAARQNFVKDQMRAEPDMEPAARVRQVVDALDQSRLTPDNDLRGAALHQDAIETAHEQIARGEPVAVDDIVPKLQSLDEFAARHPSPDGEARPTADPFLRWLRANGGVSIAEKFDITGERNAIRANRGGVFSKAGRGIDELAQAAESEGWLPPGAAAEVDGGAGQFREMLRSAMDGDRIESMTTRGARAESEYQTRMREHEADYLEKRLEMLGVDPAPARGNPDVLRAYLEDNEPRLLAHAIADAVDELRAAREQAQNPPHAKTADSNATTPTERGVSGEHGAVVRSEPAVPATLRGASDGSPQGASSDPGAAAISKASAEVAALNPDLLVQLDGMESPMRVGDLLAKVKEEAAHDAQLAKLIQVAAECALTA